MKVKPSLFLNMSPQTTEEGALAFARNMKLDDDGNLISDYGYKNISAMANYNIVGHIVGLDDKIYFFTNRRYDTTNELWVDEDKIIEYNEITECINPLTTVWSYNNGEIDGYVNTNQSGEKILTIGEYLNPDDPNYVDIPLKHINLKFANVDDESIYTQAPKAPTANLVLKNTYVKTIPNGVYVFFIRYKIRKDVYTNWFLCSRPIFGGTSEKITTLQGGLNYINLHRDSAKSFVFQLDFAQKANIASYKEFQLGFIITHDEATDARMWKHFDINQFSTNGGTIYFDYEDVEEANIDDLLETTYELYNVRNITAFKNKLYISNYIESDFNPSELDTLASKITLSEVHSGNSDVNYKNLSLEGHSLEYDDNKGYYSLAKNSNMLSYLYSPSSVNSSFAYDITKLSKLNSKEKQDIVKFSLIWSAEKNPDIAFVFNIYNYIYDKQIFGPDYADPYEFTYISSLIDEGLGIKLAALGNNLWVYQRSNSKHPWDDLGLTFAFGSFSSGDSGKAYARQDCSYFNKDSYGIWGYSGTYGWCTRDSGFTTAARSAMINKLKEDVASKSFWGKAYLEITSGANIYNIGYEERMDLDNYAGYSTDLVVLSDSLFSTDTISDSLKSYIKTWVYNAITDSSRFKGIDENGTPILLIDGEEVRANSISVRFKKFEFSLEVDDIEDSDEKIYKDCRVALKTTDYTSLCTFVIKNSSLSVTDTAGNAIQASTLMPLSTYQPYVHFVDEHNIVTNGVKLGNPITTGIAQHDNDIISLNYVVSGYTSSKYKSFFISLINIGNLVMEGFNYTRNPNNNKEHIIHCLEIDAMLYNINDNITIQIYDKTSGTLIATKTGKYYSSGSNYPPLAFGNCGYVSWTETNTFDYSAYRIYIVITRNKSFENVNNLPKSSSYIPLTNTAATPLPDGYYGSWLCLVKKPSFTLSSSCYVSGKDVYAVNRTTALSLTEFKSFIQVQDSVTYFVRSNFNLNYLSLIEDITDSIFTVGSASSGVKQVAKVINSAILSFIYELKSMYKDFSNKYFRRYNTDYKIDFDNTVRVSHVLSDETFNNSIFKFTATDYYNVPTDRGIIINLFAIGNTIFVHCKGSLYKFDGNATIAANNQDITLQESEPFDTGISQIFDSEYGYGGINNKQSGCITFDSYFFYDQSSNHIFGYSGNNQIQMIDGNVYKLLAYYKPSECKTIHDELNCRILFEFTSGRSEHANADYKTFTLSYNYKTKTFVSLHDLSLVNAFSSKHKSYSYKSALLNLFDTEQTYTHQETIEEETVDVTTQIDVTPLVAAMNINKIFGNATTACIIEFGSQIYKKQIGPFGIAVVLLPQNNIKEVVDSVKYIGDVQQKDPETQSNPVFDVLVNPQVTRTNPVVNFYIVTDSCVSSLVNTNVDDTARPNSLLDYKGFKYDMGFWTSNFFRNDINKTNIYDYPQKYPNRALDADQNSLVYGRYFIFVFDFKVDTPIKFEELFMNSDKY